MTTILSPKDTEHVVIYFVRHGQVNNPERIAYGRMPGFHLSDEGKKKAKKVGEYLNNKKISCIYTSPLERGFETANIVSDQLKDTVKIIHKYELIEIDAKRWQSFPLDELFQNKYFESFISDPQTDEVGENLTKLTERMENFTLDICQKHKGEEIVCVSHEYPIILLRLKLEGKPITDLKNLHVETGSITTLVFDENCKLKEANYTEVQ